MENGSHYCQTKCGAESGGTPVAAIGGWAKSAELYYRGRTVMADECLELGLVNAVCRTMNYCPLLWPGLW